MDNTAPSARVVEAVAQKEGVSPIELNRPLFDAVDPDALDALVTAGANSNGNGIEIEFTYLGYAIQVRKDPTLKVSVQEQDARAATSAPLAED